MNVEIASKQARMAVAWAAGTIKQRSPWLELRPSRHGWDVWWRATGTEPAVMHETARGLDWSGLVQFARAVMADNERATTEEP
jgi:hypothetical protein